MTQTTSEPRLPSAPPLVIAAHGTRDPEGVSVCRALVDRVRRRLPGTRVEVGYVELVEPSIDAALRAVLPAGAAPAPESFDRSDDPGVDAVVVPLMLGGGGHVRDDIPEAITTAVDQVPDAAVRYARPLGNDPRLLRVLAARLEAAIGDWDRREVRVVLLGRGTKVAEANAELAYCARMLYEATGVAAVVPAYLQVTRPSLPEALGQLAAHGAERVVVVPQLLLPGLLRTWTHQQAAAWAATNPATQVRVAEIIGNCDELADVVVDRYREAADEAESAEADGAPVYLSGLRLQERDVLVVGAGHVADRRVPRLLQAGARVRLVSPSISVRLRQRLGPSLTWEDKPFEESDVAGAWYVLAATNDPVVNTRVAAAAEAAHTFCVRADAAALGSAWTPAVETAGGLTVAVVGRRNPRRSVSVRDAVLAALHG